MTKLTTAPVIRDHLLDLLIKGYDFAEDLRARSDDPRRGTRLPLRALGGDALLVRGVKGVELFYDDDLVQREGAMPGFVGGGLFGKGSLHSMDGEAHRNRKATFVRAVMQPEAVADLLRRSEQEWADAIREHWALGGTASVYDVAVEVYGRALLAWAGVQTDRETATRISHWEADIVDGFAVVGPAWVRTQINRRRCDAWFTEQVQAARAGRFTPREGSAFALILAHRELDGQPLSDHLAAVELQNAIRPGIAVARFAGFLALALHEHPQWRERIAAEDPGSGQLGGEVATAVSEEVRRFYPFVPLLPAVAKVDLEFEGVSVRQGDRILIDILGTNHDEREWERPEVFDPERFLGTGAAFSEAFIPQGGGVVETGHRCPGEAVTVGLLAQTAAQLSALEARVERDSLEWSASRLPTGPRVRLTEVVSRG